MTNRFFMSVYRAVLLCAIAYASFAGISIKASAQMYSGTQMQNFSGAFGVQLDRLKYSYSAHLVASSAPGNVLFPGEQPTLTIELVSNEKTPITAAGSVEVIAYGTHGVPGDVWTPVVYRVDPDPVAEAPISVNIPAGGVQDITVTPSLPETFCGYGVVVDLGQYGRQFTTSLVRTMATAPVRIQYPSYCTDALPVPLLQRIGVHAVRIEAPYIPTTAPTYAANMAALDRQLTNYQAGDISVLFMIEGNQWPGDQPLGITRPWLNSGNDMLQTKSDSAWLPSYDDDFQQWVTGIAGKYGWPKGPVNAISLWNEPWEGISISGWGADSLRYREIFSRIGEGVDAARKLYGTDILTGGTDSTSNAQDKFFPDGKDTYLKWFDFASIHYQGLDSHATVKNWVNRVSPRGRVRIWDTESWVANTDDRVAAIVASDRAAGYDRAMGTFGGDIASTENYNQRLPGGGVLPVQTVTAWSTAAAVSAATHFIGERKFNRLLFKNGLPWVFLFDGLPTNAGAADPDDGTVVVVGDLGEELGPNNLPLRTARGEIERKQKVGQWAELNELDKSAADSTDDRSALIKELDTPQTLSGASMTIAADPTQYSLFDSFGNPVGASADGKIVIPLDGRGFYLRPTGVPGSFIKLVAAVQASKIDGIEPLAIQIHDPVVPIDEGSYVRLTLTNVLNETVSGSLETQMRYDHPQSDGRFAIGAQPVGTLSLSPCETRDIIIPIDKSPGDASNTYSFMVKFVDSNGREADLQEYIHVNQIAHRTISVDGNLGDWKGVLPQTATSEGAAGPSLTEAAWFPFQKFDSSVTGGFSTAYLACDSKFFYFAAKVADPTPDPGMVRFATRNDDDYFYPDKSYQLNSATTIQYKQTVIATNSTLVSALAAPGSTDRVQAAWESTIKNFAIDLKLPASQPHQVTLYFADLDQLGRRNLHITITDTDTGKILVQQNIDAFKLGKYLSFNLSGNVRLLFSSNNWTTAMVNGVFFDPSSSSTVFAGEDDTTQGNWIGKYGADGYDIAGLDAKLPTYATFNLPEYLDRTTLIWPAGVRHYSYRKRPDLPSGSGHDNIQIAFNVLPNEQKQMYQSVPGTMPGFTRTVDTDYEYALNPVAAAYGGGTEIWRLAVPGMPHKHFYPRQPKSPFDGPVKGGKLVIVRDGNTITYECAIPWAEIPDVKACLNAAKPIKFSFRVNDNAGTGTMELAQNRSVSKYNDSFHDDWQTHWANEIEFGWQK